MNHITDTVVEKRKTYTELAIRVAESWITEEFKRYREPTRKNTPKGDPIGLSKTKYRAALYMVLYPNSLKVKEIAEIVGVSHDVLRSWRTQKDFKKAISDACRDFGTMIADELDTITREREIRDLKDLKSDSAVFIVKDNILKVLKSENKIFNGNNTFSEAYMKESKGKIKKVVEIDDEKPLIHHIQIQGLDLINLGISLVKTIPFFNVAVSEPVLNIIRNNVDYGFSSSLVFWGELLREAYVHDQKGLRQWTSSPEMMKVEKLYIESGIDMLSDPEAWKQLGAETIKKEAKTLKKMVFDIMDILAS